MDGPGQTLRKKFRLVIQACRRPRVDAGPLSSAASVGDVESTPGDGRGNVNQQAHQEPQGPAETQDMLFDGDFAPLPEDVGFRGPVACHAAGITYRQLDYWARTCLVVPEVRPAGGSGTQRLYSFRDILLLKVVKRLLDAGISLQQIRTAIDHLRLRGVRDLTGVTLMSDGVSIYECVSNEEIIDLVHGGQGVFAIALGKVWHDLEGSLSELPRERAETPAQDELTLRRQARQAG